MLSSHRMKRSTSFILLVPVFSEATLWNGLKTSTRTAFIVSESMHLVLKTRAGTASFPKQKWIKDTTLQLYTRGLLHAHSYCKALARLLFGLASIQSGWGWKTSPTLHSTLSSLTELGLNPGRNPIFSNAWELTCSGSRLLGDSHSLVDANPCLHASRRVALKCSPEHEAKAYAYLARLRSTTCWIETTSTGKESLPSEGRWGERSPHS